MKFINIIVRNPDNCGPEIPEETVLVNPHAITQIKSMSRHRYDSPGIVICTTNSLPITTKFTSVETASDYIQQASSMSMGVS